MNTKQTNAIFRSVGIGLMLVISTFAYAAGLAGSEWRADKLGADILLQQSELFAQFRSEGKIAGNGGCNRFFGQYKISGDKIKIDPIGSTKMACPKAAMDMESAFFSALEQAVTFNRENINLVLFDISGNKLIEFIQTDAD